MKTLSEWMKENGHTDKSFGELVNLSRKQVFKIRHNLAVPRKKTVGRILEVTGQEVPATSLYQYEDRQ